MTSNENILDLIKIMKDFIENNEKSIDYTIFYNMNKEMIDDYIIYSNILNEIEIKYLFSLVKNNIKINDNLIVNIFKISNKKVEVPIIISAVKTADIENINEKNNIMINYYKLLDKIFILKANPKFIFLLWNSKNYKNINLDEISYNIKSSITKTRDNINYKIIKIDYDILFNYFKENEDRLLFQKNFINFKNLNRIFGVPLSSSSYKLNYTIEFLIDDNNILIYNIYDTIATKYIDLYTFNYHEKIYFNNEPDLIDKTIDKVIEYLHKHNKVKTYYTLFLSNNLLSRHMSKLFNNDIIVYNKLNLDKNLYLYEQFEKKIQNFTCIHIDDYNKLFEGIDKYYDNFNNFLEKYIIIDNNLSLCNICGENLEIFNFVDQVFLEKNGEVIITNNKINIFEYATYNVFIDASNYLTNIIIIFDNLFNTFQMTEFNNNCRLILDFLISINTNRLLYENTYKDDIKNSYLFIIRLNNKIFSLQYNTQELYGEKIYLNLNIIICISLILTCTFNNLFSIMKKYKMINIFEKIIEISEENYDSENVFILMITKIVSKFLNRLKIINNIDQLKLEKTIVVYLKILTTELKSFYSIIVKRYYVNFLKLIKTKNEIRSSELVPNKYCIKKNLFSFSNINKYRNIFSKTYENIEIPTYIIETRDFYIDIVNIMLYKNFNDIIMSTQLKNLIDKISYTIEYNKNPVMTCELSENIIKLNITKNKIVEVYIHDNIFFNNLFEFTGNEYFYFFNNGIILPILFHYSMPEFIFIMENFNSLLNIIYDTRYFLIDVNKIFENNLYVNKNYIYYLLYNILYIEYKITDIDTWINENLDIIKKYYNNVRNNY